MLKLILQASANKSLDERRRGSPMSAKREILAFARRRVAAVRSL